MEENKNDEINLSSEKALAKIEEPTINSNSKGPIILLILMIVIVITLCVLGALSSKSKVEKFVEVLTDDYMFELVGEIAPYTYKQGKVVSTLEVNPELLQIALESPELPMDRLALVSEQNVDGFDSSGKFYLDINSEEIASLKYAKTGDAIGFMVPDLINEYIVIKNENLKELARKIGMTEEEIETIPDKITISEIKKILDNDEKEDAVDELSTILEKYKEPLYEYLEEHVVITKKENIDIKDTVVTTKKYSITLTEKESYELIKILLDILKEDTDLYNVLKEDNSNFEYENFEDWKKDISVLLEDVEKNLADADNELDIIELSAYVKGMNTVAIELEFPLQSQKIRVVTKNSRNEYYTEISGLLGSDDTKIVVETIKEKDSYNGKVSIVIYGEEEIENPSLNIVSYTIKHSKEAEVEKLDLTKDFILNNETEESIGNKFKEIQKNLWNYMLRIIDRMPESIKDGEKEQNVLEEAEFSEENQVFILETSNKMFDKIEYGMSKDEVMENLGGLPVEEIYEETTYLRWEDEYYNSFDVILENNTVVGVSRILFSDAYSNIKISSELGTELEDLNEEVKKIKEGMTLGEVTQILGDKYLQSYKSITKEASYEWYDKAENNVVIDFDENGKVFFVGEVMNFF